MAHRVRAIRRHGRFQARLTTLASDFGPNWPPEALDTICGQVENEADATFRTGCAGPSQKIQKSSESLLTVWRGADYIRLTNEGGAPLATKKFASKSALREIQESRVSDTRPGQKRKCGLAHDTASAMSVL